MIRRPPRSTRVRSSAASDVYKRQPLMALDQARVDRLQPGVEVAGLGIGVCPGILGHRSVSEKLTLTLRRRPACDHQPCARLDRALDHQGEYPTAVRAADQQSPLHLAA